MIHIVYQIQNKISKRVYVGIHSTENINDGYLGSGVAIMNSVKELGRKNFEKTVLHVCETREEASILEIGIVDKGFVNDPNTYNIALGGEDTVMLGLKHTTKTKRKMSESRTGKNNHMFGVVSPMKGKKHSEETRRKIAKGGNREDSFSRDERKNKDSCRTSLGNEEMIR